VKNVTSNGVQMCSCQGSEKPVFFLKSPTRVGFLGFIGFYWVLGFIGFFGRAVPAAVSKHGKGK